MSIQLNIQWQQVDQLSWLWSDQKEPKYGRLDDLLDQKQQRNLDHVSVRLFLPAHWFTCIEVQLPKGTKRIRQDMLNFAAEEFIADDIEQVLLSQLSKINDGKIALQAQNKAQVVEVINTLRVRGLHTTEAFNSGWFRFLDGVTSELAIVIAAEHCFVRKGWKLHDVHIQGFTPWLEHWLETEPLADDATITVYSDNAESESRNIVTALESSGYEVNWTVQPQAQILEWTEWLATNKAWGNIASSLAGPKKQNHYLNLWLPTALAASVLLVVWGAHSVIDTSRMNQQAEITWQASENVFRQVFGPEKRIQRPIMLRELRNQVADLSNPNQESTNLSALQVLADLTVAEQTLSLDDLRFVRNRQEVIFTITQPLDTNDDSFASFEALKNNLIEKGYSVEYSASQTSVATRAQYRAVYAGVN